MKPLYLLIMFVFLVTCTKEKSCESCYEKPPPRTIPNELLARCSVFIPDESKVRKIYVEVKTKLWPGHHLIFDSLEIDGRHLYDSTFYIPNYFDMSDYQIGDSFFYRSEVRMKYGEVKFLNDTILIY